MTRNTPTIKSMLFSITPLVLVFYAAVWLTEQFSNVLAEMIEGPLPLMPYIICGPFPWFPLMTIIWIAVILGIAAAFPKKRNALCHLALWPGLILVVVFIICLFLPMISIISNLSSEQ